MTDRLLTACIAGIVALIPGSALADLDVSTELTCPDSASPGATPTVNVEVSNSGCRPVDVRILTGIVGNADQTLGGMGVYGPTVAMRMGMVPVGSDVRGGCDVNVCSFNSTESCSVDADCTHCEMQTPAVVNFQFSAQPAIPAGLSGTVATHIAITELDDGVEVDNQVDECFVDVN